VSETMTKDGDLAGVGLAERRNGYDRRSLTWRTFLRGGLTPRRRTGRRNEEQHGIVDWHEPHLLFLSIMILLLSVTDAFLTLTLMTRGAEEANPLLAMILTHYPKAFAATKMALTGGAVIVFVAVARAKVFRFIRVGAILHGCLLGYLALIAYESWLLQQTL
jgi:Domain of unknown function (DUF5658)